HFATESAAQDVSGPSQPTHTTARTRAALSTNLNVFIPQNCRPSPRHTWRASRITQENEHPVKSPNQSQNALPLFALDQNWTNCWIKTGIFRLRNFKAGNC